jgi:DNA-binding NarL/FixJ family response regulator
MMVVEGKKRNRAYRRPAISISRFTSGLPKVLVLHDVAVVSEVVKLLLADRVEVVAETRSGKAAVALCELLTPDVVIAGDTLIDGVIEYYAAAIMQTGTRVLLVSPPHDTGTALELVALGVTGIIEDDRSPEQLANAVLELASGGAVLPPEVVEVIATDWRRARRSGTNAMHGTELTSRELEVLGAMSDGLSTKAIAHYLGIAAKTVENHKTRIFTKLGVRTQAQAVAMTLSPGDGTRPSDSTSTVNAR